MKKFFFKLLISIAIVNTSINAISPWLVVIPTILCPPLGLGIVIGWYVTNKNECNQEFIDNVYKEIEISSQYEDVYQVIQDSREFDRHSCHKLAIALNIINNKDYVQCKTKLKKNIDNLIYHSKKINSHLETLLNKKDNASKQIFIDVLRDLYFQINETLPKLEKLNYVLNIYKNEIISSRN